MNINRAGASPPNNLQRKTTMQRYSPNINSEIYSIISAIEEFDVACDPAFDNDLDELERQFAELRLAQSRDLN